MAKILLVDDDIAVRTFVARALSSADHELEEASNGREGLDILLEHEGNFDLVLTDVQMPEMDGITLTENIAESFPGLTCLIMTGFAYQRERAENLSHVVSDVISKPFTLSFLRDAVDEALSAPVARCA